MDSVKKALNKGFDKATNVNNEPQVLNKSSHALNTTSISDRHSSLTGGIDHHLEKPQDPSRSAGALGTTATGVSTGTHPRQH
ncbi:hypothetical protein SMACR_08821 [Sordaria macrospora]|uniref:WGS project CABT00000000 data, contig 2.66 n=2 Tax=Sordaria macrospora TaxID=5147 RepID=F7WAW7_SORMK|nr:uncharacterized protein SMAC_08821 [Sordaria macrospora k-hell]KAA8628285.1 hypothetical protein SMACR_08821 [Sordaria macrospora]KAH7631499.1 hypothetical protein B0T09DRAFT_104407 [Sordaria sp. MPI-SDFR-AT-0083]WPJ62826.1 hypothetical protein SMAC4_08821 [Sordaria macrospora]CCC14282.1 unnamed protein product [Sordaria macrospora k-hell]